MLNTIKYHTNMNRASFDGMAGKKSRLRKDFEVSQEAHALTFQDGQKLLGHVRALRAIGEHRSSFLTGVFPFVRELSGERAPRPNRMLKPLQKVKTHLIAIRRDFWK